jgi:hypothetical protein
MSTKHQADTIAAIAIDADLSTSRGIIHALNLAYEAGAATVAIAHDVLRGRDERAGGGEDHEAP